MFSGAAAAASPADPSDVVLLFDFSGSILDAKETRNSFADALEKIADRVDETESDLVAGDATVSIAQFATKARDYAGCTDLSLHQNPNNVAYLSGCLRDLARDYRKGSSGALVRAIGDDTNYVAAMESAAKDLPADSGRPAIVMFTDGKHEAKGVPVSQVLPTRNRLFGTRAPFAFLPVGMGLDPKSRPALAAGLEGLRTINSMEACEGKLPFDWPEVTFDSPTAAGRAVALALQSVTCSFTAEPEPTPTPAPTAPGPVRSVELAAGDGTIGVSWLPPDSVGSSPVEDYQTRCQTEGGDWVGSAEGVSTGTTTDVDHLTNGSLYVCQVAAVNGVGSGPWTPSPATATPIGIPAAPVKPGVDAKDKAALVRVTMPAAATATGYRVECSPDAGATWPTSAEGSDPAPGILVNGLTNGTEYACRAFAENVRGVSDPSPLSDPFRPCGSLFECYPQAQFGLIALLGLLLALLLYAIWRWWTGRTRAYVIASVDDLDAENLGRGPQVGFTLVKGRNGGPLTDVISNPGPDADVRVRYLGGENFEVTASGLTTKASAGQSVDFIDANDDAHNLVLRPADHIEASTDDFSETEWSTDARAFSPDAGATSSDSVWD